MLMTLKYSTLVIVVLVGLSSCSTFKKAAAPAEPRYAEKKQSSPFIEHISIKPEEPGKITSVPVKKKSSVVKNTGAFSAIETADALKFKYAILMNMPVEELGDRKMLEFIEEWYGTPYRYGGNTKNGIDCSAFTCFFMSSVYGLTLPRTSREQYSTATRIEREDLSPGDLVFFASRKTISHVGVYVGNNKFAHASTSGGVMISDLDEAYFKKRWAGAGRVL